MAVEHLRERGGALITVGSVASDRAIPDQGTYAASKHAVNGFTDALRMEVEQDGLPVSISLIKPGPVDTPYKANAPNYLDVKPMNPPGVYSPDVVARAILACVERPRREVAVGFSGRLIGLMGSVFPRLTDLFMEATMSRLQRSSESAGPRDEHALHSPHVELQERGDYPFPVFQTSFYTEARLHPAATISALAAAGVGYYLWARR